MDQPAPPVVPAQNRRDDTPRVSSYETEAGIARQKADDILERIRVTEPHPLTRLPQL
jgi:hypothetical protein